MLLIKFYQSFYQTLTHVKASKAKNRTKILGYIFINKQVKIVKQQVFAFQNPQIKLGC